MGSATKRDAAPPLPGANSGSVGEVPRLLPKTDPRNYVVNAIQICREPRLNKHEETNEKLNYYNNTINI